MTALTILAIAAVMGAIGYVLHGLYRRDLTTETAQLQADLAAATQRAEVAEHRRAISELVIGHLTADLAAAHRVAAERGNVVALGKRVGR